MVAIDSDDALPYLLKYVHEPLVLAYMRVGVLEWLAGREYDGLPAVLARWLREDQHGGRDYLRQVAGSWGPYAVSCLEEADRISREAPVGQPEQVQQPVP